MPYTKTNWVAGVTPLSEGNMDNLETQYDEVFNEIVRVVKSADETVNNSTVLQNDDELLFAVGANEVWEFKIALQVTTTVAAGLKTTITLPALASINALFWRAATGADSWTRSTTPGAGVNNVYNTAVTNHYLTIEGIIVIGANAGNAQLQWAQNTAEVSDTKVLANSAIIAHQLA